VLNREPRGDRGVVDDEGIESPGEDGMSGDELGTDCDRKGEIYSGIAGTSIVAVFL
jgi:hypothetical protein